MIISVTHPVQNQPKPTSHWSDSAKLSPGLFAHSVFATARFIRRACIRLAEEARRLNRVMVSFKMKTCIPL